MSISDLPRDLVEPAFYQEFYQLLDKDGISDNIHLFNEKLRAWQDYYNFDRPHDALDGQTPYERLKQKSKLAV